MNRTGTTGTTCKHVLGMLLGLIVIALGAMGLTLAGLSLWHL